MKFVRSIAALLLLASTAAAGSYTAGTVKGESARHRWKAGPIKISLSGSFLRASGNIKEGSDVAGALKAAAAAWADAADVTFDIQTSDKQAVSPAGNAGDGVSLFTVAATPENVLLFTRDSQTAAAKTRVFYNRRGVITEADIILNPFQQFSTDGSFGTFDLQSVFTHEIGHLLGLRHSGVLGSVMVDSLSKNGSVPDESRARELSDSDISAVRDVYGTADLMDDCCAAISGRLTFEARAGKGLRVWAEDASNGRVVGQAEVSADGTFRMGGISAGSYKVFALSRGGTFEELAAVDLGPTDEKNVDRAVTADRSRVSLELVGVNGQLAETAIVVSRGRTQTLLVSGKNLDAKTTSLAVSSRFLHIDGSTLSEKELSDNSAVLSFDITIDAETPRGVYSLFASAGPSSRSVLIGAIRVH